MKPSTHFTLVASFLALLILISRAQGGYVGCYEGRTGGVSAGRYNTSTLDPTTCQTTCGTQQFSYARLYYGRYCFCSNALPSVLVNDSHCDDPCTGDALEKCGGDRHVSVYHVGAEIQGLRVTAGVFTAGVEGAIEVAVTKGSNVVYEVDYGDGTGRTEANATDFDRKTYVMPGRYAVTVYARNADGTYENKSTAVAVSVHEPVQGVQLVCPQLIGVLQEVRCNATVNAGSDMKVTVKYGDMQNETFAIVDAGHSSVGPSIPEHASTVDSTSSNDVHLMPQSEVMDPGTITAWEYYADVPGTVAFLIFRPKCPTGEQYCHVENICNSTCTLSPRQHSCSNGLFSSVRGSCVNATGGVSTEPDRSSARPPEYTIVESISHVIASRGYGVLSPSNAVDVTYGDVIGYRGIAGLLGTRVTSRGEQPDLNYTAITNAAKGDVLTTSNFAGLVQHRHLLRVVTRRPSNVLIFHKYASEGQYRADFAVSNDKINSTVTVSSQIEVWPAINQTLLDEPPAYAEISKPITFTLLPHTGRNLTYEWTFSDGTAVSTTIPSVTHTYTSIGPHNISVRVFNGLFENSTSSALVIQEPLQGVDIITDHAQLNTLHNITLNVTGGTEYSCDVDFGDDTSVVTVPVSQLVGMVQVGHVYTIGGIHTIIVSCYNMISRVNATHDIPLGVPITGLRFLKESAIVGVPYEITFAIDTGSNVTFELFFAGTPITSVRFNPNTMTGDWGAGLYTSASPSVNELTLRAINTVGTEEISVNFTTEEAIPRPALSVDHTMFQVGGTATFKLMITAGTSVSIVWDYGDGSRETYSIPVTSAWVQQVPSLSITRNHTYTAGGTPTATIIVANAYSNHTFTQQIDVITPISNLSLASNSPVAYIPPGTASIMVLQGGGAPVAGAIIKIDWGDGTALEVKDLDVGFNYYHEYEAKGNYRVTANVSNPISFMWLETGFLVAEPVTDLRLSTVPPHVPVGQPCVLVLTMYQGENVTFYVDFGDSSGLVTKTREGTTPLDEDTVTHTYSTTGNYTITVIASNMMGNTTKTYVIAVQNPVQNVTFDVSSDAPRLGIGAVQITIDFTTSPPSHDIPSEATISVEWEAGQIDSLPFDCAANCQRVLSHTFNVPGVHTSNVTIYNLASTVTYTVDTSVYETITSIGATAMYQPLIPIGGPDIVGIGPNRVAFPLNRPVKFHVNTSGTVKDYELTAHDEHLNVVLHCIHTSWPLTTLFDTANNYTVNITARNPFSSESVVLNIYLGEPVDILEIKENGTTVTGPGENKTFLVVFNSTGSDSCVYVAFDNVPYGVYGWRDACYKNYASSVPYLGVIPVGVLSITTVFPDIGDHQMSVRGFNPFTDTTVNLSFPISNVQCQKPQVSIDQQKELFYDPRVVHMKDSFQLTGITVIKCQVTLLNDKEWTLEEVNGTTGNTIRTIDISSIPSARSEEIVLPKRYLPYGVYKFTFTVQMRRDQFPEGDIFERSTATYVRVSESPLVVVVLDGGLTKVKRGHGRNITLSPGVYSKDPDLDPTADQGLTQFEYFCRQVGEEFVLTSPTGVIPWDISRANPSSPFTSPPAPNQGGCFGNGPGALNITSGELSFSTGTMLENITYEFIVIVAKGNRKGYASLLVELVSGDPPELTMRCGFGVFCVPTEGGQKIRRSSRIALISDCLAGCDTTDMNYTWSLQVQSQEGVYVTWHEIRHIDKYIDGLRGDASYSIGIKRNIYEAKPNIRQVKVTLVARRLTSAQSGSAQLILLVNDPPTGGNCSVSPTVAEVSTDKNWRIECQGWTDEDFIASYKFFALFNGSSVPKNLGFNSRGYLDTSMPKGPSYDNYWMTIYTNITDSDGSTTTYKVGRIQVNPMSTTEVESLVSNLTASGSTNMIAQIAANGNLEDTTQTIQSLASVLNTLGSSEGFNSGFGPSEATSTQNTSSAEKEALREEVALIRTQMIDAVSDSAPTTPRQVQLLASCLTEVLQQPSEIKRGSQSKVTAIVSGFIDVLQAQAADQSKEETVELATTILSSVGATIAATTYALKNPLPSDVQESMNDMYYDADLENTEQKNVAGLSKEEARNQFGRYTSDESQKGVSGSAVSTLMSGIGNVSDVLLSKTIPGEPSLGVETPQLKMELVKNDANKIDKLKLQSAKLPSWNSIRPASGPGSGDDLVSVQLVQFASNPFGSLKNSDKVANGSETVSLDLKDDNGATMAISNTQQPIEIFINRDTSGQLPVPDYIYHSPMDPADGLSYRSVNITDSDVAIHFEIVPESNVTFLVLVRHGSPPQLQDGEFDFWQLVPSVRLAADGTPLNSYEVFIDSDQVGNKTGKYYVGIRQLGDNETELYGPQWKNFTGNFTEVFTGANNITTNYTMRTYTSGCYFATVGMTAVSTEGCIVGNKTTHYSTQCYCTHLTSFMGGWVVQPNTIDWNFVFSGAAAFDRNPTLYITEMLIAVLYIMTAIWARRQDRKDVEKLGVSPLPDNDPNDHYLYEMIVFTGMRRNAGTESKVNFILSGEYDETDVRTLADDKRRTLMRGSVDRFLLAVRGPLGDLNYLRIWHDNSGKGHFASWYLKYLLVQDLQTKEKYHFICNRWFAVEEDDGQVDRLLPVAGREQMVEFGHLFTKTTQKNLGDGHLWFSVVARPPRSRFTRLQRVTCCLCLLYMTMLTSAMFYETVPESPGSNAITFGPFSLSPEEIYVGVIGTIIVFPVNLLIVTFFRKAKPRKKRPSRIQAAMQRNILTQSTSTLGGALKTPDPLSHRDIVLEKNERVGENMSMYNQSRSATTVSIQLPSNTPASLTKAYDKGHQSLSNISIPEAFEYKEDAGKVKRKKKKKPLELPWWFTIVAWILMWILILGSAFLVTMYGITFQETKAQKWITSMIISFLTSIFLTEPVKVFLLAIFFSLIIKKVDEDEDEEEGEADEEEPQLQTDEMWLHPPETYGAAKPRKIAYKPPNPAALEEAREKRIKELKMYDILREIIFYCLFLWLLMVISYGNRDPYGFLLKRHMDDLFVFKGSITMDFTKLQNSTHFWHWYKEGLVPGLRASVWYNNDPPLGQRGFLGDRTCRMMGYATMRQVRVKPGQCRIHDLLTKVIKECNEAYSIMEEEDGSFGVGWVPFNGTSTVNNSSPEYTYRTSSELDGYPHYGLLTVYGGGGYVAELRGSARTLLALGERLEREKWIDKYTRAVLVEFTCYNPGINLFSIGTMVAEFPETGGVFTSYRFEPTRLFNYLGSAMGFQIFCEVSYFVFIFFFMYKEGRKMWRARCKYFSEFWNLVEFSIIAFSIGGAVVFFYRLLLTDTLTTSFKESHGNSYIKFQYVGYWNEMYSYMLGFICCLGTLKFLKLLRFNKRMSFLAATLRHSTKHLFAFAVMFFIVFFAFVQFFTLDMGTQILNFANVLYASESCMQMMLGKFDFWGLASASELAPYFFVLFVVLVSWITINMFLSIMNESFTAVKNDLSKQPNEYEMVDFIVTRFKLWTGLGAPKAGQPTAATTPDKLNNEKTEGQDKENSVETDLNHFPEKVDRLLNTVGRVYFDLETNSGKDAFKQMLKDNKLKAKMHSGGYGNGLKDPEAEDLAML